MTVNVSNLVEIIKRNKEKKIAVNKIIEGAPSALPILPKLIADKNTVRSMGKNDNININRGLLESIHAKIKNSNNNNKNIIKLFPDIELAIQILVSSILSPKKMTDIELNYKLKKNTSLNVTALSDVLLKIKEYISETYEIEEKLPDILREALFNTGSYSLAVIPESSVDDVINSDLLPSYSAEEFKQKSDILLHNLTTPINIVNTITRSPGISENPDLTDFTKHLASENFVQVTDNVNILRFNSIKESVTKKIVNNAIKRNIAVSQESLDKINYLDIFRTKNTTATRSNVEFIKQKTETVRKSIGKPMVVKLPSASVMPVFIPGNETEHIGYFVLLDETGKPLSATASDSNITGLNSVMSQGNQQSAVTITQKAYNNLIGNTTNTTDVNQLFDLYKDVLEKQIYSSIKNSLYGSNVEIAQKNDIYFLMFTRALSEQKTSILYIPKDLLIYFAFYYDDHGIGQSLLENITILSSLRAILLFSKVMAHAKQAIDVTKVNISLDPNDPDPEKTIEQVQNSVYKLRQNFFPIGINNPMDLVNWIQTVGLQFSYENNPLLPNVKIDFENVELQHSIPDSDLEEDLRKQSIISLGLSPETIDSGFTPEFATTVVTNNILLSKRVAIYQKLHAKDIKSFVSAIMYNDEELRNILRTHILENIDTITTGVTDEEKTLYTKSKEEFVEYFIDKISDNIVIELPKPDNTNISSLSTEYDLYKDNLEKVIDSVVSSEIFSENIAGELNTHIDTIKNIYKHHLLREWMVNNNYYPEVLEFSKHNTKDDNSADKLLEIITDYLSNTMRNSDALINKLQLIKQAINKDLEQVSGNGSSSSSYSSGSDNGDESEKKDSSGSGDLGADNIDDILKL